MLLLRSSLFAAILSLLVAMGYGGLVLDHCDEVKQEQGLTATGHAGTSGGTEDDGCQCFCHQMFTSQAVEPLRIAPVALGAAERFAAAVQFPADAVPLGIEHPPQLA